MHVECMHFLAAECVYVLRSGLTWASRQHDPNTIVGRATPHTDRHTHTYPTRGSLSLSYVRFSLGILCTFISFVVRTSSLLLPFRCVLFFPTSSRFMNERNHNRCVILFLFMRIFAGVFRFEFKCVIVLNAAAQKNRRFTPKCVNIFTNRIKNVFFSLQVDASIYAHCARAQTKRRRSAAN